MNTDNKKEIRANLQNPCHPRSIRSVAMKPKTILYLLTLPLLAVDNNLGGLGNGGASTPTLAPSKDGG
jgi:hypothetical protein